MRSYDRQLTSMTLLHVLTLHFLYAGFSAPSIGVR
jgi:hypothetical protein